MTVWQCSTAQMCEPFLIKSGEHILTLSQNVYSIIQNLWMVPK